MQPRHLSNHLLKTATYYPVVLVDGPRQSGKTTLCKGAFPDKKYVSLEAIDYREFAQSDPRGFLSEYGDGAIIDEVQHTRRHQDARRSGPQPAVVSVMMADR